MDEEVVSLLDRGIDSLVKLDLVLLFDANPDFVDSARAVASRLARDAREVEEALIALAGRGLVERFQLGSGRYVLFARPNSDRMRASIRRLSQIYHTDEQGRIGIIKKLMRVPERADPN